MSGPGPHVPLPGDEHVAHLPADIRQIVQPSGLINVHRILLRSPGVAEHVIRLGATQFTAGALTPVDRELVILSCGQMFQAPYEAAQHLPISAAVGVTDEQRSALASHAWTADCFTAQQKTLLAFTTEAATSPTVSPDTLDAVRLTYTDQQVVEALVLVGYYFLIARLTTVLDLPIDAPGDDRVLRAAYA
ncbi:carboxymuconolactone decarboxylase family protein [Streptomyces sp. NBC_01005]|uniref:carboxymuconolactone decarboxylase family protein n=1 Tax=unclassified Streptomyces TaxID=2593676 RepID=UPI002E306944|nr:carboxymuconolactone decarboxylase family protein [Streptomyces sp. NBC_01362]WSW02900.1 carboxymuconolactone decarboxylase family protein [Streptomyces sp. NBC_01005]WTC92408.1 carboxymuconolactone decarboxylase family protein [Streptomyces sp. NBC_01650]